MEELLEKARQLSVLKTSQRIPGLVAHVYEELTMEKPFSKRLDEEKEVEYLGKEPRELPENFKRK